jgi:adenosylcobinamide-phosphate synthase
MEPLISAWILPLALVLDLVLGDPSGLPHPVRFMGQAAGRLEFFFRKWFKNPFTGGLAFAAALIAGTYILGLAAVVCLRKVNPLACTILEIIIVYTCISPRCLQKEAQKVLEALLQNDLSVARSRVAMLISRDTKKMSKADVSRATVETIAENFVDGVLSPLFYAAILGAPGAMAFKMISTLDSMVGYRTAAYEKFGKASARADDAANWIPARLSVPIISLAAALVFKTGASSFATAIFEGSNHKSPNAGYPEAAFAGALGVRLIGPGFYHGRLIDKPWIGKKFSLPGPGAIDAAAGLMLSATLISTLGSVLLFKILYF